jgi:hypothetical protein
MHVYFTCMGMLLIQGIRTVGHLTSVVNLLPKNFPVKNQVKKCSIVTRKSGKL